MKAVPKSALVALFVGMAIGAGLMFAYHSATAPTSTYRAVIGHLHFLIREGDAASALAALDDHLPFYLEQDIRPSQLRALERALQEASEKHVE